MNEREKLFADQHAQHCDCTLIYEPACFRFEFNGESANYTPDFYCTKTLTFYEVVGTKQAYNYNKFRILKFASVYPHLKFETVNPDGTEYLQKYVGSRNAARYLNHAKKEICHRRDYAFRKDIKDRLIDVSAKQHGYMFQMSRDLALPASQVISWTTTRLFNSKTAKKVIAYIDAHPPLLERGPKVTRKRRTDESCARGHAWSEVGFYVNKLGTRVCKQCNRESQLRSKQRRALSDDYINKGRPNCEERSSGSMQIPIGVMNSADVAPRSPEI